MPDVLRVDVQPATVELKPGGDPAQLEVRIFNGTAIIDEFSVAAIGTEQWLQSEPAAVRLFPDKEGTVALMLEIAPGAMVPAGDRSVTVQVSSTSTPGLSTTKQVTVRVATVAGGVALTLQPQVVRGGSSGNLTATLSNGGNAPLQLSMAGSDAEGAASFSFSPQQVTVPVGGSAAVGVRVAAPREFFGTERQRSITVRAEGAPTPLTASATFVQAPRFTPGTLRALRTLLTLLAAAALIGGAFATWVTDIGTFTGVELGYKEYAAIAFSTEAPDSGTRLSEDVVRFFTSAGFVSIFFGALVLLGAPTRTGKLTRVAGMLALVVVLAVFAVLFVSPDAIGTPGIGIGAIAAAAGAVVAIVGGSVGT
jgi:hypothetical protein